jgi:hypothetical protein
MKIGGPNELFHFLTSNGLRNVSGEASALINCIEEYGRLCTCDSVDIKNAKMNQCRDLYVTFVTRAVNYKGSIMAKVSDPNISFYLGKQLLLFMSR